MSGFAPARASTLGRRSIGVSSAQNMDVDPSQAVSMTSSIAEDTPANTRVGATFAVAAATAAAATPTATTKGDRRPQPRRSHPTTNPTVLSNGSGVGTNGRSSVNREPMSGLQHQVGGQHDTIIPSTATTTGSRHVIPNRDDEYYSHYNRRRGQRRIHLSNYGNPDYGVEDSVDGSRNGDITNAISTERYEPSDGIPTLPPTLVAAAKPTGFAFTLLTAEPGSEATPRDSSSRHASRSSLLVPSSLAEGARRLSGTAAVTRISVQSGTTEIDGSDGLISPASSSKSDLRGAGTPLDTMIEKDASGDAPIPTSGATLPYTQPMSHTFEPPLRVSVLLHRRAQSLGRPASFSGDKPSSSLSPFGVGGSAELTPSISSPRVSSNGVLASDARSVASESGTLATATVATEEPTFDKPIMGKRRFQARHVAHRSVDFNNRYSGLSDGRGARRSVISMTSELGPYSGEHRNSVSSVEQAINSRFFEKEVAMSLISTNNTTSTQNANQSSAISVRCVQRASRGHSRSASHADFERLSTGFEADYDTRRLSAILASNRPLQQRADDRVSIVNKRLSVVPSIPDSIGRRYDYADMINSNIPNVLDARSCAKFDVIADKTDNALSLKTKRSELRLAGIRDMIDGSSPQTGADSSSPDVRSNTTSNVYTKDQLEYYADGFNNNPPRSHNYPEISHRMHSRIRRESQIMSEGYIPGSSDDNVFGMSSQQMEGPTAFDEIVKGISANHTTETEKGSNTSPKITEVTRPEMAHDSPLSKKDHVSITVVSESATKVSDADREIELVSPDLLPEPAYTFSIPVLMKARYEMNWKEENLPWYKEWYCRFVNWLSYVWTRLAYAMRARGVHKFQNVEVWCGRIGFGAKTIVYGCMGGMTCASSMRIHESMEFNESPQGAFLLIGDIPTGEGLLLLLLISLLSYSTWRFWESFTMQGADATFSKFKNFFSYRFAPLVSGIVYLTYSGYLIYVLVNSRSPTVCYPNCWRSSVAGQIGLVLFGIAFTIASLTQLQLALTKKWHSEINWKFCENKIVTWAILITGHIGFVGRASFFLFTGVLMFKALRAPVKQGNNTMANGINQLLGSEAGIGFMFLIGFEVLIYAVFALLCTRYRFFPTPPPSGMSAY